MAKQSIQMPTKGGAGRVLGAIFFIALIVIVVKYPNEAAGWATDLIGLIGEVVDGLVSFVRSMAG